MNQKDMSILDKYEFITNSPKKTIALGKVLGSLLSGGEVILLIGELGTGKTTLIKGIALGLSIEEKVSSPSFVLINEYRGRFKLFHFDLWRLQEDEDLGYDDYFSQDGVYVIEWAEKAFKFLPDTYLKITISHIDRSKRRFLFIPKGRHFIDILDKLRYNINN